MGPVIAQAKADKQRIEPQQAFELTHHRDRAAAVQEGRIAGPFRRQCPAGSGDPRAVGAHLQGRAGTVIVKGDRTIGGQAGADMILKQCDDALRVLIVDQPERHLGRGGGRNDGLEPGAGIAAGNAVDLAGRAGAQTFIDRAVGLARRTAEADGVPEGGPVKAEVLPLRPDIGGHLGHAVIKAGMCHPALGVVRSRQHIGQQMDRVAGGAAKDAGMQDLT